LKDIGITHILSVESGNQHIVSGCKHLNVPMSDKGLSNLKSVIEVVFPFMEEAQQDENKLLVHCQLGQNRSPTVVMAWLMKTEGLTLWSAHKLVKEERKIVHPHPLYVRQLREYDKELWGVYSTPPDFLRLSVTEGEISIANEFMSPNESSVYMLSQLSLAPPGKAPPLKLTIEHNCGELTTESNAHDSTRGSRERILRSSRLNIPPILMNLSPPISDKVSSLSLSVIDTKEDINENCVYLESDSDDKLPLFVEPNKQNFDSSVVFDRYNEENTKVEKQCEVIKWTI